MSELNSDETVKVSGRVNILIFGFLFLLIVLIIFGIFQHSADLKQRAIEEEETKSESSAYKAGTNLIDAMNANKNVVVKPAEKPKNVPSFGKLPETGNVRSTLPAENKNNNEIKLIEPDHPETANGLPRFTNEPKLVHPEDLDPVYKQRDALLKQIYSMRQESFIRALSAKANKDMQIDVPSGNGSSNGFKQLGNYDPNDLDSIRQEKERVMYNIASLQKNGLPGALNTGTTSSSSGTQVLSGNSGLTSQSVSGLGLKASNVNYDSGSDGISSGEVKSYADMRNNGSWSLTNSLQPPASDYLVRAGTVIPATTISGINSDIPGQIIAQVSQNVYDTATGKYLLIPQGTRIVGTYGSSVSYGQERVMVAWQRLIYPDNRVIDLGSMPGADQAGFSGLTDQVNNHWFKLLTSAFLLSGVVATVTVATDRNKNNNSNSSSSSTTASDTFRQTMAAEFGNVIAKVIERNLNVSPTLEIRPGYKFNIMVTKDITFAGSYKLFGY